MREKDIKRLVRKQLKKDFPHWRRLTKKEKKRLADQVLEEVVSRYQFDKEINVPLNELTGTTVVPSGIISLTEMEQFVADVKGGFVSLSDRRWQKHLKDSELKAIDALLDDAVINRPKLIRLKWSPDPFFRFLYLYFRA